MEIFWLAELAGWAGLAGWLAQPAWRFQGLLSDCASASVSSTYYYHYDDHWYWYNYICTDTTIFVAFQKTPRSHGNPFWGEGGWRGRGGGLEATLWKSGFPSWAWQINVTCACTSTTSTLHGGVGWEGAYFGQRTSNVLPAYFRVLPRTSAYFWRTSGSVLLAYFWRTSGVLLAYFWRTYGPLGPQVGHKPGSKLAQNGIRLPLVGMFAKIAKT